MKELEIYKNKATPHELDDLVKGKISYDIFKAQILERSDDYKEVEAAKTIYRIVLFLM